MSFSDSAAVAQYAVNLVKQVPGLHALHKMAHVLLAEHVPTNGRVLVLGAGGGMELKALAQASPAWRFTGVDPSPEMLALAKRTLGEFACRVDFVEGLVESAPNREFDGATCLLTLHFLSLEERLRTLRELKRRLRPGAPLVVAHHSVSGAPEEKLAWFQRWAAFTTDNGLQSEATQSRATLLANRLPTLPPECEVELLELAGFERVRLFYAALSFRGWVACARNA